MEGKKLVYKRNVNYVILAAIGFGVVFLALFLKYRLLQNSEFSTYDYPNFKVQFVDENNGFIMGPRLLKTENGGADWSVIVYEGEEKIIKAEQGPETKKKSHNFRE
jgi:hypothetical protein